MLLIVVSVHALSRCSLAAAGEKRVRAAGVVSESSSPVVN